MTATPHQQPHRDIYHGVKPGIFLISGGHRLNDGLISNAVSHRLLIFFIFFFDLHGPALADLVELMHIAQRDVVRLVQLVSRADRPALPWRTARYAGTKAPAAGTPSQTKDGRPPLFSAG